jgi:predicted protein tyrosine phosphatase
MSPIELAYEFHETYERLAPNFGYETREDTKEFDPETPNGKLMTAVCGEILTHLNRPNRNRMSNLNNEYQKSNWYPRTLVLCSAGLLRSPTTAWILSNPPYSRNTRAIGVNREYALIPVDQALLNWADEIVCMEDDHHLALLDYAKSLEINPEDLGKIYVLNVPDSFAYRDPKLVERIQSALERVKFPKPE